MGAVRVFVTDIDIRQGEACSSKACPLANAILRAIGPASIHVYGPFAWINGACFKLPKECEDFAWKFDSREPVDPFSFLLDLSEGFSMEANYPCQNPS